MNTGVSGATALSSSSVGRRFSANWCSVKPPTTRTHCGAGVIGHLPLEHAHRVGQAAHAVPAQLQVEVEAAADDVQVVVDQAGQHAAALEVDRRGWRGRPAAGRPRRGPRAVKRPSLMATALAIGLARSSVVMRPWCRIRSGRVSSCRVPRAMVCAMRAAMRRRACRAAGALLVGRRHVLRSGRLRRRPGAFGSSPNTCGLT